MFKAVRNAGFNEWHFPRLSKYVMVSEPEAGAVYIARDMQDRGLDEFKLNQCFILCDAGGRTVEVVGYRVKQVTPTFEFEQMTIPTGMSHTMPLEPRLHLTSFQARNVARTSLTLSSRNGCDKNLATNTRSWTHIMSAKTRMRHQLRVYP